MIWFLMVLSQRVFIPAHLDRGFKVLPHVTYVNVLDKNLVWGYTDTCCITIDTTIQKVVKKTITYEIESLVFTYQPDSFKPIEQIREINADSFIVISSTDPTGTEEHNRKLALKRAEYLKQFLKGEVREQIRHGMGRFSIIKTFKRR